MEQIEEMIEEREVKAGTQILEMVRQVAFSYFNNAVVSIMQLEKRKS